MKITVIGAGYVGLPLAAILAEQGHQVFLLRRDKEKSQALKDGKIPFFEPGIEELVKNVLASQKLQPTISYQEAIPFSEVIFVTVGTPPLASGEADLSSVLAVAEEIGKNLKKEYTLVINKSTVLPGTTKKMGKIMAKYAKGKDFGIVFSPEFLREGSAISDTKNPDRIIIGGANDKALRIFKKLHRAFKAPILKTGLESAEMIKYAANNYLALRIVFINQIADLCQKVGVDVEEVIKGIGLDKRIGKHYWYPGLGYGGSCFPKDVAAFAFFAKNCGLVDSLFLKMHELNEERIFMILRRIKQKLGSLKRKRIGILGLSCKQGTDDIRGSPAVKMIKLLEKEEAFVSAFDPLAMEKVKAVGKKVVFCQDPYEVATKAEALLILNDWPQFVKLDYAKIKRAMKGDFIFDSRNLLSQEEMISLGFRYKGLGR